MTWGLRTLKARLVSINSKRAGLYGIATAALQAYRDARDPRPRTPRIAVHMHLYYLDLGTELLSYLQNVHVPFDLFITVGQPAPDLEAEVARLFANVHVRAVANRGKDIGPFIDCIYEHALDSYDLVLKVHAKKSNNGAHYIKVIQSLFGNDVVDGDAWRRLLLAPIVGSPAAVRQVLSLFANDAQVGMVGSKKFLCCTPDTDRGRYEALCARLGIKPKPFFFAGSMFWIRGSILRRVREAGITFDDFALPEGVGIEGSLEHCFERVFGALTESSGYKVLPL